MTKEIHNYAQERIKLLNKLKTLPICSDEKHTILNTCEATLFIGSFAEEALREAIQGHCIDPTGHLTRNQVMSLGKTLLVNTEADEVKWKIDENLKPCWEVKGGTEVPSEWMKILVLIHDDTTKKTKSKNT